MSAWIVSKTHIDYIVTESIRRELIGASQADATGQMLWRENCRSIDARYPYWREDLGERPGYPVSDAAVDGYLWRETPLLSDEALVTTLGCYRYQSCEHDEWKQSEAYRLVERLVTTLPQGWDTPYDEETPWGWDVAS